MGVAFASELSQRDPTPNQTKGRPKAKVLGHQRVTQFYKRNSTEIWIKSPSDKLVVKGISVHIDGREEGKKAGRKVGGREEGRREGRREGGKIYHIKKILEYNIFLKLDSFSKYF